RTEADVTLDVKGRDQTQLVGADIHRGPPGANGPVVLHLSDGGFIATAVHIKLTPEQLRELASGQWYASMKTTLHPDGELRGQILPPPDFLPQARPGAAARPPAQAPNPGGLGPPSTGDAGLAP
ncbi:MAG TPA: CHRD domain-containing protein, partial [Dehalococcoidia bacterium]